MTPGPWAAPSAARHPDGRLHLHHGPIDLIIEADASDGRESESAYRQAAARFDDILATLVSELPLLRTPLDDASPDLRGPVARRMLAACWPHRATFITPMAAVAGAVADEVLAALVAGRSLRRAYVNNGGDIAVHLAAGERFVVGLADIEDARLRGALTLAAEFPDRGVATSGWRGRSQSLGIADAVTVVARTAAAADAAATLVANAVNVDHPSVSRAPARSVRDDSDLGDRLVTIGVAPLPDRAVRTALDAGVHAARAMIVQGLIRAACLRLQGQVRLIDAGAPTFAIPQGEPHP